MDSNPYLHTCNFVDLFNVQLSSSQVPLFGTQDIPEASNYPEESPAERRKRRKWTPVDDIMLISSWLNTSKDPVVGNEQRCGAFWKRIAAYFAASPKIVATEHREASNCKQGWHKINDLVNKFCGAYEAANREKTHEIFFNNHKKKKIILEHAWKELRNDQKWCEVATSRNEGSCKRRTREDGSQSETSHAKTEEDRPSGVKAAKEKKPKIEAKERMAEFQSTWAIKQQDLAMKERLSKMSLLNNLVAKKEPLAEYEEALKKKLINELLAN
ncbi:hypothetical protein N665_0016s0013 [Sinapis alba]|nr:hypothetical protein N665_0016s0013 [Sinapis alba]